MILTAREQSRWADISMYGIFLWIYLVSFHGLESPGAFESVDSRLYKTLAITSRARQL